MQPFGPNEHILALDFDGVIGNSVHECLLVAFNAYYFQDQGIKIRSIEELDAKLVQEFTRIRNYIRSGADFMYILMALEQETGISNQQDFDGFASKHQNLHESFFARFYKVREELSTDHFDLWLELNPFYEGMAGYLKKYPRKDRLYIITTKKIEYVIKLLSFHDISLVNENLFTADKKRGKRDVLLDIAGKHSTTPENVWYIDDQVDTLKKIIDTGTNCLLALWGYNNKEQQGNATISGIPLLRLDEFRDKFAYPV